VAFVDRHQHRATAGLRWGVEPICRVLQVAPSIYCAAKRRPPSRRAAADAALKVDVRRVDAEHYAVYGAETVWRQLGREGDTVGRDRVARLMRELGLAGATRARTTRTTRPAAKAQALPADLARRDFTAAIISPRPWAATCGRAPGSQYQHCSRVNRPLTPSISHSM
jgi:putative transposase